MGSDKDGGTDGIRGRRKKPTTIDLTASEVRSTAPPEAPEPPVESPAPVDDASGLTAGATETPFGDTSTDARPEAGPAVPPGPGEPAAAGDAAAVGVPDAVGDPPAATDEPDAVSDPFAATDEPDGAGSTDADAAPTGRDGETAPYDDAVAEGRTEPGAAHADDGPRRRSGSIAASLAAGIVGGLVVLGAGAALVAADLLPLSGTGGQVAAPADTEAIDTRFANLEGRVDQLGPGAQELAQRIEAIETAQSGAPPGDDLSADVSDLRSRLDAVTASVSQSEPDIQQLDALSAEVEALRSELATIQAELPAATGGNIEDAVQGLRTDLSDTLQGLRVDLGARLEALQSGIAGARDSASALNELVVRLETRLEDIAREAEAREAGLSEFAARIEAIEQRLDEGPTGGEIAALSLAVTTLASKVTAGEPFAADLALVQSAAPDIDGLEALAASANKGVPTTEALVASFPAQAILATRVVDSDTGVMDRLLTGAQSLVNYRETGMDASDPIARIVAGIQASLAAGDLGSARAAVDTLPEPARAAASGWVSDLDRRLLADRVVAALTERLLTRLQAPAEGQ